VRPNTTKCKNLKKKGVGAKYLKEKNLNKEGYGMNIKALVRLRCGNMEESNKYWLSEEKRVCVWCEQGQDNMEHYVKECVCIKDWFNELGKNDEDRIRRIWNEELDGLKGYVLRKV